MSWLTLYAPDDIVPDGARPQVFTVDVQRAAAFTVQFCPPDVGTYTHELLLRVKNNPFEHFRVAISGELIVCPASMHLWHNVPSVPLPGRHRTWACCVSPALLLLPPHCCIKTSTGEGYLEDIAFEGLQAASSAALSGLPSLVLPDVLLPAAPVPAAAGARPPSRTSATSTAALVLQQQPQAPVAPAPAAQGVPSSTWTFTIANRSSNRHYRFKWPEHPCLRFSPGVGHLHAGTAKAVTVTFSTTMPVKLDGQDLKLALSQITYKARTHARENAPMKAGCLHVKLPMSFLCTPNIQVLC
jgi:hypothetical protein